MSEQSSRRDFLGQTATLGLAAVLPEMSGLQAGEPRPAELPKIRLGNLEVSRLILGSNPFYGWAHGNPQGSGKEMTDYFTPARIKALLDEAADQGITAVWTPCYDHWIRLWQEYQEKGGKLRIWIAQPDRLPMEKEIQIAIKNGARAVCVQGEQVDRQFREGNFDTLRRWVDLIKEARLPAGLATHRPTTHPALEERKMPTDFYHQCVYQPENYGQQCLDQALATIAKLDKPVVAYKVLGAGRVTPKEAIPRLLGRVRAKDGLCLSVFPRNNRNQLAENADLVRQHTARA